ncbi:unnamed protein product, partial [Nesidiocoris tenuis]
MLIPLIVLNLIGKNMIPNISFAEKFRTIFLSNEEIRHEGTTVNRGVTGSRYDFTAMTRFCLAPAVVPKNNEYPSSDLNREFESAVFLTNTGNLATEKIQFLALSKDENKDSDVVRQAENKRGPVIANYIDHSYCKDLQLLQAITAIPSFMEPFLSSLYRVNTKPVEQGEGPWSSDSSQLCQKSELLITSGGAAKIEFTSLPVAGNTVALFTTSSKSVFNQIGYFQARKGENVRPKVGSLRESYLRSAPRLGSRLGEDL